MWQRVKLTSYTNPGRLADVLALIQVLALDPHAHRSESGLSAELPANPLSASDWQEIAEQHPEFFRVAVSGVHRVSLISRHVQERNSEGERVPLDSELVRELMKIAIDLHDVEARRNQQWALWLPHVIAFLSLVATILVTLFNKK